MGPRWRLQRNCAHTGGSPNPLHDLLRTAPEASKALCSDGLPLYERHTSLRSRFNGIQIGVLGWMG